MENVYEVALLLDFYGQLLTKRQYEILDLHYNNDYSLGEISQQLGITRQGVFDNIKRGKELLQSLENKLGLVKKFVNQKNIAKEILVDIDSIETNGLRDEDKERLKTIRKGILSIIDED